jgi:hypothetical protein
MQCFPPPARLITDLKRDETERVVAQPVQTNQLRTAATDVGSTTSMTAG